MSNDLKREIVELKSRESKLERGLAQAMAKLNRLDDDRLDDKKERDRLKKRRDAGQIYDREELQRATTAVLIANDDLKRVRFKIRERRSWLKKTRLSLSKSRRQLRNRVRPNIIDLKLGFRPMATQSSVDKVIGHYTAGPQDENTADAIRLCKIYHEAHLNQGWSGEAYMLCFTIDGDILLLRPAKYVGAHTLGYNTGSYGIMMHGTTGDKPSAAQKRALQWWAKNGHTGLMGSGQTSVRPGKLKWFGHNDYNPTSCPGEFKPTYRAKGKA